jgi:hypothetical protein
MAENNWSANSVTEIEIDLVEWMTAADLLAVTSPWEDKATGFVLLRTNEGRREWIATDTYSLVRVFGRADDTEIEIALPPRLISLASNIVEGSATTRLIVREFENGGMSLFLDSSHGEVFIPWRPRNFPAIDNLFAEVNDRAVDGTVDSVRLSAAIRSAMWAPEPLDEADTFPKVIFGSQANGLWIEVAWPDQGATVVGLNGNGSGRDIAVAVNPRFLQDVVDRFSGTVDVAFGDDPSGIISFRGNGLDALLMPIRSGMEMDRVGTEDVIEEVFGPDALIRDSDGDYQLKTTGVPVWSRLLDGDPVALKVFATVAADVEASPELFSELNDINASLRFARVDWNEHLITVSSELVASTLDPEELFNAFTRVNKIAEDMSGIIVARFGGRDLNNDAQRWQSYLETDILAELSPHGRDYLNGENALPTLPFDDAAYVITAANPHNLLRSENANHEANLKLAVELAKINARYCACAAESRNDSHFELGFLVWNLPLESILAIAGKFRQETVFGITQNEFQLINVHNGEVISSSRNLGL